MRLTASSLRQDIYRILDEVLETGIPVEIERKGRVLRIVPSDGGPKLSRLSVREYLDVPPEDIVSMDWSAEWRP